LVRAPGAQNLKSLALAVPEIYEGDPKVQKLVILGEGFPGMGVPFGERGCLWRVRQRHAKKKSGRCRPTLKCYHAETDSTTRLHIVSFAYIGIKVSHINIEDTISAGVAPA